MRPAHTRQFGFSLMELLVVIAIVAVLVGLIFPAVTKAIRQVQMRKSATEIKQVATGFRAYNSDNSRWPFYWDWNTHHFQGTAVGGSYNSIQPDNPGYETVWWWYRKLGYSDLQLSNALNETVDLPVTDNLLTRMRGHYTHEANLVERRVWLLTESRDLGTFTAPNSNIATGLVDGWGNVFYIRYDMNDDGQIPNPFEPTTASTVRASVIIWSAGPDGTNNTAGENSPLNRDNIKSWD